MRLEVQLKVNKRVNTAHIISTVFNYNSILIACTVSVTSGSEMYIEVYEDGSVAFSRFISTRKINYTYIFKSYRVFISKVA